MARIVENSKRPIQVVFAGKAHPQDEPGKQFIQKIVQLSQREELQGRIVFLEGYDLELARHLVQGVDVWLNTPRRPYEASGTSGMKAAFGAGLNLSILDGWWCEAFQGKNGWSIGNPDARANKETLDELDALALYDLLEYEVAPAFYTRGKRGIPQTWVEMMKSSLATVCGQFSSHRMMQEYTSTSYRPAMHAHGSLTGDHRQRVVDLSSWWNFVQENWHDVRIVEVDADLSRVRDLGEEIPVTVRVESGPIDPRDLVVETMIGTTDGEHRLQNVTIERARHTTTDEGQHVFYGSVACRRTGKLGLAVRVRPATAGSDLLWDPVLFHWG